MRIVSYTRDHLPGVLTLCREEGWPTFVADPDRAHRALVAPGVTTVVVLQGDDVVGLAQLQSDGEVQAHLSLLVVAQSFRRQGFGRQLLHEALKNAGGIRVDLVTETGDKFYESLRHKSLKGYRVYPDE